MFICNKYTEISAVKDPQQGRACICFSYEQMEVLALQVLVLPLNSSFSMQIKQNEIELHVETEKSA